jgi:hypothetical protein
MLTIAQASTEEEAKEGLKLAFNALQNVILEGIKDAVFDNPFLRKSPTVDKIFNYKAKWGQWKWLAFDSHKFLKEVWEAYF